MIKIDENNNKVVTYDNEPDVERQLFPNIPLTVDISPLQDEIDALDERVGAAEDDISSIQTTLQTFNGQPVVVDSVEDMTDENIIYVYVGDEAGYTSGDWYYYDGTEWVSGGAYVANPVVIDDTLTQAGEAADAKAVGDELTQIKSDLSDVSEGGTIDYTPVMMDGWYYINNIGRIELHGTKGARTFLIDCSDQPEEINIKISSAANRARFLYTIVTIDNVQLMTTGTYWDGESTRNFTLTKANYGGFNTIAVNTDYNRGESATYATIEVTKTYQKSAVDKVARGAIDELEAIGKRGFTVYAKEDTITDDSLVLSHHINNKKNAEYDFWGKIGNGFTSVSVGHGYNVSYSGYVVVDATTIKWYSSGGVLQKNENHGLTLTDFIHIEINQGDAVDGTVTLITNGGNYELTGCSFAGSHGDVFCTIAGTMTDVSFSAIFRDLKEDVWYFGDSYVSMGDRARWPWHAVNAEHTRFYLCGYGGEDSSAALTSLRETLTVGTPRIIIWGMGMNGSDTSSGINATYLSVLETVMDICEEKNIELILCTIPNTPTRLHTYKNAYVKASGYRYVDFAAAVNAEDAGSTWYEGMLEGSNTESEEQLTERVHPTVLGAKTLYERLITDAPEMVL